MSIKLGFHILFPSWNFTSNCFKMLKPFIVWVVDWTWSWVIYTDSWSRSSTNHNYLFWEVVSDDTSWSNIFWKLLNFLIVMFVSYSWMSTKDILFFQWDIYQMKEIFWNTRISKYWSIFSQNKHISFAF